MNADATETCYFFAKNSKLLTFSLFGEFFFVYFVCVQGEDFSLVNVVIDFAGMRYEARSSWHRSYYDATTVDYSGCGGGTV